MRFIEILKPVKAYFMKRILLLIVILNVNSDLKATEPEQNNQKQLPEKSSYIQTTQAHQDNTPVTLGRIAAIISFFSNVVANPNDHKNVATSILGIISTIFTLAADTRQLNFNYLELQDEIVHILKTGNPQEIALLQDMIKTACDLQIENLQTYANPGSI